MNMMKRKEKGSCGYIRWQKFYTTIRTILLFALALGLYAAGYITTGTNKNLLTIIAVLGLLPASKSMVNMIMFLRYRSVSEDLFEKYEKEKEDLVLLYEMILTTAKQAYFLPVMAYRNRTLCAFCPGSGDLKGLEDHLTEAMKTEHVETFVKIFPDERLFLDRIQSMRTMTVSDQENKETETVLATLKALSL